MAVLALAVGGVAAALLASKSANHTTTIVKQAAAASGSTSATDTSEASSTGTTNTDTAAIGGNTLTSDAATTTNTGRGSAQSGPTYTGLTTFSGNGFTIGFPAGWAIDANAASHPSGTDEPGYDDTYWSDPSNPALKFIVDVNPSTDSAQAAADLRRGHRMQASSYHETDYESITEPGGTGQKWVWSYASPQGQTEVYEVYFSACSNTYAVAGEGPAHAVDSNQSLFDTAIRSFRPRC